MNRVQKGLIALDTVLIALAVYFIIKVSNGFKTAIHGYLGAIMMIIVLLIVLMALADLHEYVFGGDEDEYNNMQ